MLGKFITFEGGDGCGKSTQVKLLAEYLKSKNINPVLTKEPELLYKIAKSVVEVAGGLPKDGGVPVTVKIRSGWDKKVLHGKRRLLRHWMLELVQLQFIQEHEPKVMKDYLTGA